MSCFGKNYFKSSGVVFCFEYFRSHEIVNATKLQLEIFLSWLFSFASFISLYKKCWSDRGSWIYNYLCSQCLTPLKL